MKPGNNKTSDPNWIKIQDDFAILRPNQRNRFRILQVTDFHSNVDEVLNEKTRMDIRAMVRRFAPDLLAVTGDIWCGDDTPDAAPMWMQRDLDFLGSLGVPWAFIWGNHDYAADFEATQRKIAATPNAVAPQGNGRGNFRVEVRRGNQAIPCWDLFFLNSGPQWQLPQDLAWFQEETARITQERGAIVPAIAYFHIPLKNYQDAIDQGRTIGEGTEYVLNWGDEEGLAAPIFKQAGNVRACFTAHSHKNDFWFEEDGVVFAYGRATGYGGYGGEDLRKGGKLLELDLHSDHFSFMTVFGNGAVELKTNR